MVVSGLGLGLGGGQVRVVEVTRMCGTVAPLQEQVMTGRLRQGVKQIMTDKKIS